LSASMTVDTANEIKQLFLEFQSANVTFFQTLKKQPWGARNFHRQRPGRQPASVCRSRRLMTVRVGSAQPGDCPLRIWSRRAVSMASQARQKPLSYRTHRCSTVDFSVVPSSDTEFCINMFSIGLGLPMPIEIRAATPEGAGTISSLNGMFNRSTPRPIPGASSHQDRTRLPKRMHRTYSATPVTSPSSPSMRAPQMPT
jgi:hypothetical protein